MNLSYLSLRTFSYTCLALLALFLAFSNSSDVSWNLSLTPSNLEKKISLFHTIERKIMSKHSINTNARHLLIQVLISHLFSVPLYVPVCIIINLSNKINDIFMVFFPLCISIFIECKLTFPSPSCWVHLFD